MIAVLFNKGNVRLGEVSMPEDCLLIDFGGGYFVRTDANCELDRGGFGGTVFEMSDCHVRTDLDTFNPTSHRGKRVRA